MCEGCIRDNKRGRIDDEDIMPAVTYISGYDGNGRPFHGNFCNDCRSKIDMMGDCTLMEETSLI